MSERKEILKTLEPLFKEAEAKGLWFHCSYQDLWFSPAKLREEHANGSFIWGAVNWTLRHPSEKRAELKTRALNALEELKAFETENF